MTRAASGVLRPRATRADLSVTSADTWWLAAAQSIVKSIDFLELPSDKKSLPTRRRRREGSLRCCAKPRRKPHQEAPASPCSRAPTARRSAATRRRSRWKRSSTREGRGSSPSRCCSARSASCSSTTRAGRPIYEAICTRMSTLEAILARMTARPTEKDVAEAERLQKVMAGAED